MLLYILRIWYSGLREQPNQFEEELVVPKWGLWENVTW